MTLEQLLNYTCLSLNKNNFTVQVKSLVQKYYFNFTLCSFQGTGIPQSLQRTGYRLDNQGIRVQFPEGIRGFMLQSNPKNSDAHPFLYPSQYWGLLPLHKAARL
jgi:hypothetical protein